MLTYILYGVICLLGLLGGAAAGYFMELQARDKYATVCPESDGNEDVELLDAGSETAEVSEVEYVKLPSQFIVPVLENSDLKEMVVLSLSLEVALGSKETVYHLEPKIRDSFLSVLFNFSNLGGFSGNYVNSLSLDELRDMLLETGLEIVGPTLIDVLIVDMVKQRV